jgi:uroporphyrinogen decarboxylase
MPEMTSHERFSRMYQHRQADRVPIIDEIWRTTVQRWRSEGLPEAASPEEYFGLDRERTIGVDNTPRLPERVVTETDEFIISTTSWGATLRQFKHRSTTPELLDVTVKNADDWRRIKDRMVPSRDRIDWDHLKLKWPRWREQGNWIVKGR